MNEMNPAISIIITVYNGEKYLGKCLDSALNQTLPELEIICIDGNSTDRTCNIIASYMSRDKRVKLYTQDRPGIGAAKNCGIEHATGKYITFLDSDDFYVDSTALEKMYYACIERDVKVCGAFRSTLFMDGSVSEEPLHRQDCADHPDGVLLYYADKQYDYHFHSYIYDSDMIINSDARFAEVKAYDDTHFFIRAMLAAGKFFVVPVELYRYRCGPAYDWSAEKADDAILALTDQLCLSKEKKLARLHWLTFQRINYEYGHIFVKNIRLGDYELLRRLLAANDAADANLIRTAIEEGIPERDYLEPMMHRRCSDMPLRQIGSNEDPHYLLEPVWELLVFDGLSYSELFNERNQLRQELTDIQNSRSYKLARKCLLRNEEKQSLKSDKPLEIIYAKQNNVIHPKVSVVVPVFNVKKYLAECLDSILGQSLQEIEILCGDGGSDDGSLEILRNYAEKDPRITIISRKGSGYGQSVNECMDMACGDYIGIVESDDVVRPETFETLYCIAQSENLDWIRSDIYLYYSGMPESEQLKRESIIYGGDFYDEVLDPQTDYRPYKSGLRTWSGIYKRDFLNSNGIRHNETPGGSYQDVGFYLKTLYYAHRVYFLNQAFYMWRQDNPGSSIHYNASKLVDRSLTEWHLNYEYIKAHPELPHRAVASYRYRQFFSYMWTVDMADETIRAETIEKVCREFQEGFAKGEYESGFFEPWEWQRLQEFLGNHVPQKEERESFPQKHEFSAKQIIKLLLRPLANLIRKIVEKSMRNVLWEQQRELSALLLRINETAGDTQWQVRECASSVESGLKADTKLLEENEQRMRELIDKRYEVLNSQFAALESRYIQLFEYSSRLTSTLQEQYKSLEGLRGREEDIFTKVSETGQKIIDQGDVLWEVKSRGEDIYMQVSETGQKVLDQGDVLWGVKSRGEDIYMQVSETGQKVLDQGDVLWKVKDRSEDIFTKVSETGQKIIDQGDVLWGVKSRGEDIYMQVSETGQKVLDQGDVLWGVKSRVEDVFSLIDPSEYAKSDRNHDAVNSIVSLLTTGDEKQKRAVCKKFLSLIEIEVFSRCNRQCWFCPNSFIDRHSENIYMDEALYLKILSELREINYSAIISYSRFNEPLADHVILTRLKQAREYCPHASLEANSNGDYLTREYLDQLAEAGMNRLGVQCYFGKGEVFSFEEYKKRLDELCRRLRINGYEFITNRPEDRFLARLNYDGLTLEYFALNMTEFANDRGGSLNTVKKVIRSQNCVVPFRKLYVEYDGSYMMCCNVRHDIEIHRPFILGNARDESVFDIFSGKKMIDVRKSVGTGTMLKPPCISCQYTTLDDDFLNM